MIRLTLCVFALSLGGPVFAQRPVGFRTDGTGRYPDAKPPIEWGPNTNVVWKIALSQSNAIPVILGDKLFTCADPGTLLCVNKADGKILWRHESSYKELLEIGDTKTVFEEERQKNIELNKQQSALDKQIAGLRNAQKDGSTPPEEIEKKLDALKIQTEAIKAQRARLTTFNRYNEPGKGAGGYHPTAGYTSPTPVTDGKHIYVIYGNGLAACYDLEGNRLWLKLIEHPTAAAGHGASPVLVEDKLLVHFTDLVALHTNDGSEAWRLKIPPSHGTSMHARLGDVDVAFHPQGYVIRVSDGAILAKNLGATGPNSPLVQDGKIFYVTGQVRGYALPDSADIPEKWIPLLKGPNLKGGGRWYSSPILHDGLLYALNGSSILYVIDANTGKLVYDQRLEFDGGESYASLTIAGSHLYASSDNGTTLVLEPGREYKEVARNSLETFRSSPIFEGRRMYLRTTKGLWCIGE